MAYELNYKGFEGDLLKVKNPNIFGEATYVFMFPNGFGAHINVCDKTRFRTLWSLAGLKAKPNGYYDTTWAIPGVMDDFETYLTDKDVRKLLKMIKEL